MTSNQILPCNSFGTTCNTSNVIPSVVIIYLLSHDFFQFFRLSFHDFLCSPFTLLFLINTGLQSMEMTYLRRVMRITRLDRVLDVSNELKK